MTKYYTTYEDLVANEANGWVIGVVLCTFATGEINVNTFGPFATKREATNAAARVRRQWKNQRDNYHGTNLVKVQVRPLWKDR